MGPTWVLSAADGPHFGPMNLAIREVTGSTNMWSCLIHALYTLMFFPARSRTPIWMLTRQWSFVSRLQSEPKQYTLKRKNSIHRQRNTSEQNFLATLKVRPTMLNRCSLRTNQWVAVLLTFLEHCLTHWGRVTHICVSKIGNIGSDNGLSPGRRQAIIWCNAEILLIGPLGQWNLNLNSWIFIQENAFENVVWKMAVICVIYLYYTAVTVNSALWFLMAWILLAPEHRQPWFCILVSIICSGPA